jgi:hypothetical protein
MLLCIRQTKVSEDVSASDFMGGSFFLALIIALGCLGNRSGKRPNDIRNLALPLMLWHRT